MRRFHARTLQPGAAAAPHDAELPSSVVMRDGLDHVLGVACPVSCVLADVGNLVAEKFCSMTYNHLLIYSALISTVRVVKPSV